MRTKFIFALMALCAMASWAQSAGDYKIITTQPEGELSVYDRGGYSYYVYDGYIRGGAQTGTIDIVFSADNKVYMKDPLAKLPVGSWVEGTLSDDGKTITVPLGQYLYFDNDSKQVISLKMVEYDDDEEWCFVTSASSVTYTIADGTISLNGTTRKGKCLGGVWDADGEWAGYADYSTVYTPAVIDELVELPAGVETCVYKFNGLEYNGGELNYNVNVGFDGDDMYIQGIFGETPTAWIKGTRNGNTVIFEKDQFLGKLQTGTKSSLYMTAVKRENTSIMEDLILTYDEEAEAYVNSTQFIVLNTTKNAVYMMQAISDFSLTLSKAGNAYEVPYSESFGSATSLNEYTIIDANGDGVKWVYNSMNSRVEYGWSMVNAADDWLITPAIHLEAGKNYKFSLNARGFVSSFPERMEVKMGTAATVEAMTVEVIAPTVIATGDMTEFSGNVSVAEDGDFYFGIHAISDADNMMLAVDDVSVVEDETTGIDTVADAKLVDNVAVYTLDGRLVSRDGQTRELPRGLYIKNGKKLIVR